MQGRTLDKTSSILPQNTASINEGRIIFNLQFTIFNKCFIVTMIN